MKRMLCAALVASGPMAVSAMEPCGPRDVVAARLVADFGEKLTATGLQGTDQVMEIWASDATGSFTVLVTRADGQSCVVATGTDFMPGAFGALNASL